MHLERQAVTRSFWLWVTVSYFAPEEPQVLGSGENHRVHALSEDGVVRAHLCGSVSGCGEEKRFGMLPRTPRGLPPSCSLWWQ